MTYRMMISIMPRCSTLALAALAVSSWSFAEPSQQLHLDRHHEEEGGAPIAEPAAQEETHCDDGKAGEYPCKDVDLLSFMPLSEIGGEDGAQGADIWGWTDPANGREYAVMALSTGTSFVDITNPTEPVFLGFLPTHSVAVPWRDVKVYKNHAFIVSEAPEHGMQVFSLKKLSKVNGPPVTFSATAHYAGQGLSNSHNIAINEKTGFAYIVGSNTCAGGLHMVNIKKPKAPKFAGCYSGDGYTHDAHCVTYRGPDSGHAGNEICFNANEDTLTVVDVSNKNNPRMLTRTSYPGVAYTHQSWTAEDQLYLLLDDELDERTTGNRTKTFIWDIVDLDNPELIGTYTGKKKAIDHNLYVRDGFAYQANYQSGLRILDLKDVASGRLTEVAFFDIFPAGNQAKFNGAWSNYPYFSSGVVIVSGIEQGLFILHPHLHR